MQVIILIVEHFTLILSKVGVIGNFFSAFLLAAGIVTILLALEVFKKKQVSTSWFGFLMLSIAIWAISYGIEISRATLAGMLFWVKLEYLGISFLPACWILFIVNYIDKSQWVNWKFLSLIFAVPVITLILVWTNQWHHLHYERVSVSVQQDLSLLQIEPGIWYRIFIVFFYLCLAAGIFLLLRNFSRSDLLFKKQNFLILAAAFFPWLVNILYLSGLRPYQHLDLTPFAFLFTGFVIWYGLLQNKLFDLIPIARGKVMDSMHEGVIVLDKKSRVIDINQTMVENLSGSVENIIGSNLQDLFPAETQLNQAIRQEKITKIECTYKTAAQEKVFAVSVNPLTNNNNRYRGSVLLFWDVTQQKKDTHNLKKQAEELEELNQLQNKLISIISHDLRSPLSNLLQLVTMLNEKKISPEEYHHFLPTVTQNLRYTSNLLENLLSWTRSQMNNLTIHNEWFNLQELIHEVIQLVEKQALDKGIIVINEITHKSFVFADKAMIELVLRNLLSNAVKFCRTGDYITISARVDLKEVTVCVKDTGIGISTEDQKKLFGLEIFSKAGTAKEKGAGIGLALCKDFITKNNGRIWVESKKGEGSAFFFSLNNGIRKFESEDLYSMKK